MRRPPYLLVVLLGAVATPALGQRGPCDNPALAESQRAGCVDSLYARTDSELNRVYRRSLASSSDTARRVALIASQRAWLAYKKAQEKLLSAFAGGSRPGEQIKAYVTAMAVDRTGFLLSQILGETAQPSPAEEPREAAYLAAMKADLRNLVTAEEAFFADSVKYTARIGPGGVAFLPTEGNSLPTIQLTRDGWTATNSSVHTAKRCVIFVGSTPVAPAAREGEPRCQ